MSDRKPVSIPRNVTMYPEQWEVVEAVDSQNGFRSTSTALRYIVEKYRQLAEQTQENKSAVPAQ